MKYKWEVQDVHGEWHVVTEVQAMAYRLDGVPVRITKMQRVQRDGQGSVGRHGNGDRRSAARDTLPDGPLARSRC